MKKAILFFVDMFLVSALWIVLLRIAQFLGVKDSTASVIYLICVVMFARVMLEIMNWFHRKIQSVRGNYQVTAQLKAVQRDWIPFVQKVCIRNNGLIIRTSPVNDLWINCKFEQSNDALVFLRFLVENKIELFAEVPQ